MIFSMNLFKKATSGTRPVDCLEGLTLEGGWKIIRQVHRRPGDTGGCFSVGYIARKGKEEAFVKALDFIKAFQTSNWTEKLQTMLDDYHFERDTSLKLSGLNRVVTARGHGSVDIPGFPPPTNKVSYLILELAQGDIRGKKFYMDPSHSTIAVKLRGLHNIADGLNQMHQQGVAHQDIKPSNVFVFDRNECKVGDLGCSSDRNKKGPNDNYLVPGDPGYSPPEHDYVYLSATSPIVFNERKALDLYLLGSLFFFNFMFGTSARAELKRSAVNMGYVTGRTFQEDLPILSAAFSDSVKRLELQISNTAPDLAPKIASVVHELCHPDPSLRGNKRMRNHDRRLCSQRYVSKIDYLAKRAEFGLL